MKSILLSIVFVLFLGFHLHAQGCSDAGLCSTESFRPIEGLSPEEEKNRINFGLSMGAADYDIAVYGGAFGYSRAFSERWSADAKITFLSQGGNDIHVAGLGDVFLNLNYKPSQRFEITMGAKIPLMNADKMENGLPLPMDYQSSLGTLDFLGGISYSMDDWFFALGVQIPLQQNENAFFASLYPPDSPLAAIQSTNQFKRQADILLRITRPVKVNDKMTITPGLLPIYHLAEDEYTAMDGTVTPIEGSDGLTLNGTVFVDLLLSQGNALQFSIGFPFVVRKARPDGLTRSFVFGLGYAKDF